MRNLGRWQMKKGLRVVATCMNRFREGKLGKIFCSRNSACKSTIMCESGYSQ